MYIDPALLSPVSALLGALIGGSTSLAAAVYTQRTRTDSGVSRRRLRRATEAETLAICRPKPLAEIRLGSTLTLPHTSRGIAEVYHSKNCGGFPSRSDRISGAAYRYVETTLCSTNKPVAGSSWRSNPRRIRLVYERGCRYDLLRQARPLQ